MRTLEGHANSPRWNVRLRHLWLLPFASLHPLYFRDKGLEKAVRECLPEVYHVKCFWHILCNVNRKFKLGKDAENLAWALRNSVNQADFDRNLAELEAANKGEKQS